MSDRYPLHMRLFVAIELPGPARAALATYADTVRQLLPERALRWVPVENLHLTVAFVGETREEQVADVIAAVDRAAAQTPPLSLRLTGSGRFTSAVWVGIAGDVDPLAKLAADLADALGLDARFHAHVTVARVRDPRRARRLTVPSPVGLDLPFTASELVLFRSDEQPVGPPVYVAVHRAPFTSRAPVPSAP